MPVYEANVCESYPPEPPSERFWNENGPGNPTVVIWAWVAGGHLGQRQLRVFTLPANLARELFGEFFRQGDWGEAMGGTWIRL
jgi:hypothetical protein